jgi:amino acid adenylation domain-containing protein
LHDAQQSTDVGRDIGLIERTLGTAQRQFAEPISPGNGLVTGLARHAATSALLAALAAVLQRHTDRSEQLLGFMAGGASPPRAVRLDLSDEPSFAELCARAECALASEHGGPGTDEFNASDLETVLALGEDPPADARFDLWLTAQTAAASVHVKLHYDQGKRDPAAAEELLGHLETLLEAGEQEPSRAVTTLPLLTGAERARLLERWNATAGPYPGVCVHELISDQARRRPQEVAVEYEQERLSYEELETRANRLANHLRGLGVGPDVLVGICVERSAEMVVGLLGILKAGGAYVPIDPAYPADRQAFMLTDAQAPIVLTQESLLAQLPVGEEQVICLDRDWPTIAQSPAEPPQVPADPEQLAYVIYTSGSTGRPKGVQIPHRALVNFLWTMRETPGLGEADVLLAVTTLSFDIAGLELYLPLIVGGRVVLAPRETASDPRALAGLIERRGTTVMQATPTTWRMLIDSEWKGRSGLRALCGGEALPGALADQLVGLGLELWNMYGPTETTIWSTCARIGTQGEQLTIGRPIANTTLYVLDAHREPVPIGVPGELWIGGDGLARGYRGRPDLTEERFVAHPFDPSAGARIYRTGDLVRYRRDGNVEYLGRIDHQVKVRGFRIELGEIETVLSQHPGVAAAVVVAREGAGGEPELAGYVVAPSAPVGALELRQFLSQTLPAYMVPSTVTTLDAFPLTPNGKIDRKALPEPTRERSDASELVAARSALEQRLVTIWQRELDIHSIGVTDNFFDLGVTSIVAARLFAAIEHEIGDSLPLGAIFRAPTIERLARLIEGGAEAAARWSSLVPIQPDGTQPPMFCVHGGGGTVLHIEPLARRLGPDQPLYGLQSRGLYGGATPLKTVEEMATHYLSEMRQVQPPGAPWHLTGYCFGSIVAFEMAHQLAAAGEDVRVLAVFNGPAPAWIHRYGWYGNQPSQVHKHVRTPRATKKQRLLRLLREPSRLRTGVAWETRRYRARIAIALKRPLPEQLREYYFFRLHHFAERAYEPQPFEGEMLVFYGDGLYEDPDLGWTGLATEGILSHAIPGEHDNNRQAMSEPGVGFVAEQLQEYLSRPESAGHDERLATVPGAG